MVDQLRIALVRSHQRGISIILAQDVDQALFNSLRVRFELGLFDPIADQPYWKLGAGAMAALFTTVSTT